MEKVKYIFADQTNINSNKVWCCTLGDDGSVVSEYGRVGKTLQTKNFGFKGESFFRRKIREKEKKGYKPLQTLDTEETVTSSKFDLAQTAKDQITYSSKEISKLIDELVQANIHQITSNTKISYNKDTGLFMTDLGPVKKEAIDNARGLLGKISKGDEGGHQ